MASLDDLKRALVEAHNAGDAEGAAKLAEAIDLANQRADVDKSFVSGVMKGVVSGTIGLPGDLREAIASTGAYDRVPFILRPPQFPSTADITRAAQDATGLPLAHEPQSNEAKFVHAGMAGAGSMLLGGKISAPLRFGAGFFGGLAGQAAENATQSNAAGAGAQTLATLLPLMFAARKPQVVKALQKDLEGMGALEQRQAAESGTHFGRPTDRELVPEALKRAQERASHVEGVTGQRPALPQTTDQPTALSGVMEEVSKSPAGRILDKTLLGEQLTGEQMIRDTIQNASSLETGQSAANRILRAGQKAVERPGKVASASASRDYKTAKRDVLPVGWEDEGTYQATRKSGSVDEYFIPPKTAEDLVKELRGRVKSMDLDETASGKEMRRVANKVINLALRYPEGIPVGKLDALGQEARLIVSAMESGKAQLAGADIKRLEGHKAVAAIINDAIKPASEALTSGKNKFSRWANSYGAKVQDSGMPDMFPKGQRVGDYQSMGQVLRDYERYSPEDIAFVAKNLRRADPEAFPGLFKQRMEEAWANASKPAEGRTPQQAMNNFVKEVAGTSGSKVRLNYLETVRQAQLAHGATPEAADAAARGAAEVMDALLIFSRDRGGLSAVHGGDFARQAGANWGSNMLRSVGPMPFFALGRTFERHLQQKVYEQIAHAMTSPEGAQELIRISQFSAPQRAAEALVRSMVAGVTGAEE